MTTTNATAANARARFAASQVLERHGARILDDFAPFGIVARSDEGIIFARVTADTEFTECDKTREEMEREAVAWLAKHDVNPAPVVTFRFDAFSVVDQGSRAIVRHHVNCFD